MEIEQEARQLGWIPLEEFKGDESRWVDAATFVERGHTVMPILKKNNEKLEGTVRQQAEEIRRLTEAVTASRESIGALQQIHQEATAAAVERAKKDLLSELKQAKTDGDIDREVELTDQLATLKAVKTPVVAPPPSGAVDPDFVVWANLPENSWFGKDNRKTLRAMSIANQLRADEQYDNLVGKSFYDEVSKRLDEVTRPPRTDKVSGGGTGGSDSGPVKGYNDLPADAKAACDRQSRLVVGEGRAFKNQAEWRTYYSNLYSGA